MALTKEMTDWYEKGVIRATDGTVVTDDTVIRYTFRHQRALQSGFARAIKEYVQPLFDRIKKLEEREKHLKYVGVWRSDESYHVGNFATHNGNVWHCNETGTRDKPGTASSWTLAVKSGRDGKDAQ